MKWTIAAIGKPKLAYARAGAEEYLHRLRRLTDVEVLALRNGRPAEEGAVLLERTAGAYRMVLDERGDRLTSAEFSRTVESLEVNGTRRVAVLIGGSDGHPPAVRAAADRVLSLSSLTLQHELALVVVLEQIYRAYSILRGLPYHRE